jgi:hypothetical protein
VPAVWLRFRAELRRRWRAWLGLGLLLGFSAGIVAAIAVGARRTETVVARFQREFAGYDAYVSNFPDPGVALIDPARIEALPMVASSARGGVIAAQATFLALVAVVLGLPLGIVTDRTAWSVYADRSGFISVARVPAVAVLLLGMLAVLVAEVCAAIPARAAARTRPAQLLRSE